MCGFWADVHPVCGEDVSDPEYRPCKDNCGRTDATPGNAYDTVKEDASNKKCRKMGCLYHEKGPQWRCCRPACGQINQNTAECASCHFDLCKECEKVPGAEFEEANGQ